MKKIGSNLKKIYEGNDKSSIYIYFLLRAIIILCMIRELINGNFQNAMLCVLSLILFVLPFFVEKKFKIKFPSILEIIIFLFIFSAEILGEISNFYVNVPHWDTILHTLNGFLCASIGFSLIYLLNENSKSFKLSPIFVALVSFCFSMTVGVVWEFFEYGMDSFFGTDMQKDYYVSKINSVTLDETKTNTVINVNNIEYTITYDKNNDEIVKLDGYLDIGLHDTMKDLIVNFVGAFVYSIFGYLYIINKDKYKLAGKFITEKEEYN